MTKALKDAQDAVLPHLEPPEITEPSEGALDFPAPPIAPQLATVLVQLASVIPAVRRNQLDAASSQSPTQRIAVVAAISDDPLRTHPRPPAPAAGYPHGGQCRLGQGYFIRRGRGDENSQRYTLAIGQYHGFRALAALRFTDCEAPFLAGKNVASKKVSSQRNRPRSSSMPSSARQARNQTPRSSQRRNRRQHVTGLGYCGGRSRQRAPLRSTHRMPSTQARLSAAGRPGRPVRPDSGNKFSIAVHCCSVSLIPPLKRNAVIQRKYLI
jgi:hypothetical protein